MKELQELLEELPPHLQQEVLDFAEFLLEKSKKMPEGTPHFRWAGALKDLRGRYTSVELQHKASDWRLGEK
jgi:galactose-1-phosphate uridylyltransferase